MKKENILMKKENISHMININSKSSRPEVFCKKDVLKNFAKFPGKQLCQSLFLNNVAGLQLH